MQEAVESNCGNRAVEIDERINQLSDIVDTGFENLDTNIKDNKEVLEMALTGFNEELDDRLV